MPVPLGDLAVICAPTEEREITADTLWRHEQVVEALMEDRDLLPVRFGTRLDDDAAAARSLAGRRAEFKRALERVRGAVELSVRAVFLNPDARVEPRWETGADYLRLKRRITAAQETVASAVHEPLSARARAYVLRSPRPPAEALRAAYLVERGAVGRVRRARRADRCSSIPSCNCCAQDLGRPTASSSHERGQDPARRAA